MYLSKHALLFGTREQICSRVSAVDLFCADFDRPKKGISQGPVCSLNLTEIRYVRYAWELSFTWDELLWSKPFPCSKLNPTMDSGIRCRTGKEIRILRTIHWHSSFDLGMLWPPCTQTLTVGFWCQTIHKKFLRRFDNISGLKMMMKSGLENVTLKFHGGLQRFLLTCQTNSAFLDKESTETNLS